jgi:hypothetical protein
VEDGAELRYEAMQPALGTVSGTTPEKLPLVAAR